jgi:hypothetical protein
MLQAEDFTLQAPLEARTFCAGVGAPDPLCHTDKDATTIPSSWAAEEQIDPE